MPTSAQPNCRPSDATCSGTSRARRCGAACALPDRPATPSIRSLERAGRRRLFLALVRACWEDGEDISDRAALARVAAAAGFDAGALLAEAASPAIKQQLADATAQAARAGVFGVPTFRFGGELFWGGDRIEALLWRLRGGTIDEAGLEAFLARAPLATRKR